MASQAWRSEKVRQPLAVAEHFANYLETEVRKANPGIEMHFGGSLCRKAPQVGDIDLVIVTSDGVLDGTLAHQEVALPAGVEFQRKGSQIAQGDLTLEVPEVGPVTMHVDVWCCTPEARGAFLMFIRGPKELNVAQRSLAIKKGYNLSQVGLFQGGETIKGKLVGGTQVDNGTEEDIYRILEMPYLTPEARQAFAPIGAEVGRQVYQVTSSKGDKTYSVKVAGNSIQCTCPGYSFRMKCRHIEEVQQKLGRTFARIK